MMNTSCFKLIYVLHALYLIVVFFGLGVAGYWALDREFPRVVLSGKINPIHATPGGVLHVEWQVNALRSCTGRALRTLEGDCGVYLLYDGPIAIPGVTIGVQFPLLLNVTLPETVSKGRCEYHTTLYQYCNPLHHVFPLVKELPPLVFYVD